MGLRCSVLGHHYGERERIEERDESGDEIIVTVRDIKTCERCDHELVVSEATEVTAAPGAHLSDTESTDPPEEDGPRDPVEEPSIPEEDDAIIMDDTSNADREPGQWPDDPGDDDTEPESSDPADWPEVDADADEGFDAVTGEDAVDEVIETAPSDNEAEEGEETETGFVRAKEIGSPSEPSTTAVHTEYYCPRCSWSRASTHASVRPGDICPECRIGYLAERDDS